MRIQLITGTLGMLFAGVALAQPPVDSVRTVTLDEVVVSESYRTRQEKLTALPVEVVRKDFLTRHFSGNLVQTLEHVPGVHSMDIGAGFSKPVIRGLGFNRIAVSENGIKQEGQQWGSDHGLEIDAFNVDEVRVRKGPASLLFGSDAMGGVIEVLPPATPILSGLAGEAVLLGKSVNGTLGGSLMLGWKRGTWYVKGRYSEQRYGDYRVPTDTVVYLTQKIPVYGRRLKNTAGLERNASLYTAYSHGAYRMNAALSNAYQRMGFFAGAHGVPDLSRLQDDGNSRNIELPYSLVNHLKLTTHQELYCEPFTLSGDFGWQYNHREEWSAFHTHYDTQPLPERDPDKEIEFRLHTFSSSLRMRYLPSSTWEHTAGIDLQVQRNDIGGYAFLLPEYRRATAGVYALTTYRQSNRFMVSGGVRYDVGHVRVAPSSDPFLAEYLRRRGYEESQVKTYEQRSIGADRRFGDYSLSAGVVWNPTANHLVKVNLGRSFRLPGANELAANGVHHGTFRHEQGDPKLRSERGWQVDASYSFRRGRMELTASPFLSLFDNYIYLRPTGEWSVLPHAGQIYRYTGARVVFAGGELLLDVPLMANFSYRLAGEYVYTRNRDEHTALSFSPPASLRNTLTWERGHVRIYAEWQAIARQRDIARNEDETPGANLMHVGANLQVHLMGAMAEVSLDARNVFDTKYYNHLSFYRKVEIPEAGRNFQLSIKIPINQHSK